MFLSCSVIRSMFAVRQIDALLLKKKALSPCQIYCRLVAVPLVEAIKQLGEMALSSIVLVDLGIFFSLFLFPSSLDICMLFTQS
ncbi:Os10g0135650 [Oryza sativa Japonica Group]|uniref:Os10g0135650 protein n=1 Tax=Oryza sativa subsp. japonica TaxID=39947 RepID=A0A0P0XRI9_ORYSJ|nr:Os10g0135650 [Oryza sativa Japonica Group]